MESMKKVTEELEVKNTCTALRRETVALKRVAIVRSLCETFALCVYIVGRLFRNEATFDLYSGIDLRRI